MAMGIERWDPFRDLRRMDDAVDRLWRSFGPRYPQRDEEGWSVPLDVEREGDDIVVRASMPGVDPSEISVTIEDGVLTLRGETASTTEKEEGAYLLRERRTGTFHRSLRLPESVNPDGAASSYVNGVVTVRLPKAEEKKAKRLTVEVKESGA